MKVSELISIIEAEFPLWYQEDYDNSGLLIGQPDKEISSVLLCVDTTEDVIREAINKKAGLIISHHPVIFQPLKKITTTSNTGRIILSAVQHNIAIYCAHTNVDNLISGVNQKICQKLGLKNCRILAPQTGGLRKLVTYVPVNKADEVRAALFEAGAGHIGNYDFCSFNVNGTGSFRAAKGTHPYSGSVGELHFEEETRIETIFPAYLKEKIIAALLKAHPYEEVAYDIFITENENFGAGAGMIGETADHADEITFINTVKNTFKCKYVKYSALTGKKVKSVAVCGGSGSFLLNNAILAGADVFITSDVKYHQFFDADKRIVLLDIGHFESEQFTIDIFYEILIKKLPNFAIHFSTINTSPIYYL